MSSINKKKILILCRRDDRIEYDRRITMLRGLGEHVSSDVEYIGADFEDLLFDYDGKTLIVTDTVSGVDVADHDAIFLIGWFKSKPLDDTARAVAFYARAKGVPFVNSEAYHGRSFSKLSQCVIAALYGVTVTPFIFSLDKTVLEKAVLAGNPTYPYIAKAIAASRGQDNYLITNHKQLQTALQEESDPPKFFMIQKFVPNDGDYRILVMGDKVRLVIHRQSQSDSHLNNTSQGGKATLIDLSHLPQKVLDDAIKMGKMLRREVTGVDMIMHKETGEYFFLEANNMPQLGTGSFVGEKLRALDEYLREISENKGARYID